MEKRKYDIVINNSKLLLIYPFFLLIIPISLTLSLAEITHITTHPHTVSRRRRTSSLRFNFYHFPFKLILENFPFPSHVLRTSLLPLFYIRNIIFHSHLFLLLYPSSLYCAEPDPFEIRPTTFCQTIIPHHRHRSVYSPDGFIDCDG